MFNRLFLALAVSFVNFTGTGEMTSVEQDPDYYLCRTCRSRALSDWRIHVQACYDQFAIDNDLDRLASCLASADSSYYWEYCQCCSMGYCSPADCSEVVPAPTLPE